MMGAEQLPFDLRVYSVVQFKHVTLFRQEMQLDGQTVQIITAEYGPV